MCSPAGTLLDVRNVRDPMMLRILGAGPADSRNAKLMLCSLFRLVTDVWLSNFAWDVEKLMVLRRP